MSDESRPAMCRDEEAVDFFEVWYCAKRSAWTNPPPWPAYVHEWASRSEANRAFLGYAAGQVALGARGSDEIARVVTAIKINLTGSLAARMAIPEAIAIVTVSPQAVAAREKQRLELAILKLHGIAEPGNKTWELIAKELGV